MLLSIALIVTVPALAGQQTTPPAGRGGGGAAAYPPRTVSPEMAERGRLTYSSNCAFCHGADTRGASGPSLLRSQLVQDDRDGETIATVVRSGRPPMPAFDLTDAQLSEIAAFLHSFAINSRDPARNRPIDIVTGNATEGQAYFGAKCGSCHKADGDLKGIAARYPDPRELQQWWLLPGGGRGGGPGGGPEDTAPTRAIRATVTLASGQKYVGRLVRIDEFKVSIIGADLTTRTFSRNGEIPKVEINDPLAGHKALLREYTDQAIHDVTAYLVTLK
jgi:mono/diheme cytochrome c family protein